MDDMRNNYPTLDASLDRMHRVRAALRYFDSAERFELLAGWKESIMDNLVQLLAATNDVGVLSNIDKAIALSREIASLKT